MTIKEAENVQDLLIKIKDFKAMGDRLISLHRKGEYEKVTNIGCEMARMLLSEYESQLDKYPSPLTPNQ